MSRNQFFAAAFSLAFVTGAARAQPDARPGAFIVRDVDAGAYATRYTLERVVDGSRIEVEVGGRGALRPAIAAGTLVIATGAGKDAVLRALLASRPAA
jgi:hypothetical protein